MTLHSFWCGGSRMITRFEETEKSSFGIFFPFNPRGEDGDKEGINNFTTLGLEE